MADRYERLKDAIKTYKAGVDKEKDTLKKIFLVDIIFISIIISLLIVAVIFSNLAGLLTSLGLGTANVFTKGKEWATTIKSLFVDIGKLEKRVDDLDIEIKLCNPKDDQHLNKVESLLNKYRYELISASKK